MDTENVPSLLSVLEGIALMCASTAVGYVGGVLVCLFLNTGHPGFEIFASLIANSVYLLFYGIRHKC